MQLRNILLLAAIAASTAAAQPSWLSIETMQNGFVGACGAPGEPACYPNTTLCASGSSNQIDPYSSLPLCEMAAPSCTTSLGIPLNSAGGTDFTFLVITDTHLRNGYGITDADHLHHAQAINGIPLLNLNWKDAGAGFDDKTIAPTPPFSIVSTGDLTDYGQASEEGAFRLLYESGRTTDSVNYSLYPGLGNHDVSGQCILDNCALRMFAYPAAAASCSTSVDPLSHNFSWNWHQFHMVQLNMWAGDTTMGSTAQSTTEAAFTFTHPSGLAWLATDLANTVGTSGAPVVIFQHFGFDFFSMYNNDATGQAKPWWTAAQRQELLDILQPYNVIALFSGHQHHTGMYSADYQDSLGNNKILDDFTGGAGGIDGHGEFYVVRLTDNFLDVLPFQWSDSNANTVPVMRNVGDPSQGSWPNGTWNPSSSQDAAPQPDGALFQPEFYNNVNGCRKWIGPALNTVPLTITTGPPSTGFSFIITNNTDATIQGPFALQTPLNLGLNYNFAVNSGAALNSVSFMGSCAEGPAYQELTSNQLAPGQSETITLFTTSYVPDPSTMAVVSLGTTDSFLVAPGTVTVGASTPAALTVATAFGKNIPFTLKADPELTVTVDSNQTPANMTIALNTSTKEYNKLAYVTLTPAAGYSGAKVTVNLAAVPITISASGNDPVYVDGVSTAMPQTFNWYPGDAHTLNVQPVQQIDTGTQDRFISWSATGAALAESQVSLAGNNVNIEVPPAAGGYVATYSRYYLVTPTITPAGSGTVTLSPATPDNYEVATQSLTVTATPNSGYTFSAFGGTTSTPTGNSFTQTVNAPLTFSAQFAPGGTFTVTTQFQASGSETVDGQTYTGPVSKTWTTGSSHTFSVPAQIVANTTARYLFTSWSDGVTDNPRTITAGTPITYLANYQTQFLVTTSASPAAGGSVLGGGWYNRGATASLEAVAVPGFLFSSFSGNAGTTNPQTPTVNQPINVVANFLPGTPTLFASAGARNDTDPAISYFTFELTESGQGVAENAQIVSVTTLDSSGTGTVTVPNLPLSFGTLLPGQIGAQTVAINWPNTATRVGFTVHFSANNGAYTGQSTFYVFR